MPQKVEGGSHGAGGPVESVGAAVESVSGPLRHAGPSVGEAGV